MNVKIDKRAVGMILAARGMDQKGLAEASGVSEQTIVRLLKGLPFSSDTLGKLATALDCNPVDLVDTSGFPDPLVEAPAITVQ